MFQDSKNFNKVDVSIVYHGHDRMYAARIASALHRSGITVWTSPENLVSGFMPNRQVEELIHTSRVILYLISSATLQERWASTENQTVIQKPCNVRLVPVLVEDLPSSTVYNLTRGLVYFDFTDGDVDVRTSHLAEEIRLILSKRKLFISYSHHDFGITQKIARALSRRSNIEVWSDWNNMQAGSIIRRGIERGIADADYLIAVLSQNVIDTVQGWIGFELDQAYERERERNMKNHYFVIPAVIENGLNIPGWLSTKVYVDITKNFRSGIKNIVKAVSADPPRSGAK